MCKPVITLHCNYKREDKNISLTERDYTSYLISLNSMKTIKQFQ